jgi:site-specific recombinase XerD
MILICFYCGLRLSELLSLKEKDFNWVTWRQDKTKFGHLTFVGKGNKERMVYVPPDLMAGIEAYIQKYVMRTSDEGEGEAKLFRVSKTYFEELVRNNSKEAIKRRIKVHTLRHSFSSWLYDKGLDIVKLQQLLGHQSIATTQLYTHISNKKLGEAVEKAYRKKDKED